MFNNKNITLKWIYLWCGLTVLFAMVHIVVANTIFDLPTFIIVCASFVILIATSIWQIVNYHKHKKEIAERKRQFQELFDVYYEQSPNDIKHSLTLKTSKQSQEIRITLIMKAVLTLDFIVITFEGNGTKPNMEMINNWQYNMPLREANYDKLPDGWNCSFIAKQHKNVGQHIKIGIKCIAETKFEGNLKIYLMTEEGAKKEILLPLRVD